MVSRRIDNLEQTYDKWRDIISSQNCQQETPRFLTEFQQTFKENYQLFKNTFRKKKKE